MSIKDEFPIDENDLSSEETELYKRMKSERDAADSVIDDYDILDNIVHRDENLELGEVEEIIRKHINTKSEKQLERDYDRAIKGVN